MKPQRVFFAALLVSLSLLLVFCGCERKKGTGPWNQRPGVQLSGGPPNGGTDHYAVLFRWWGWDMDGYVDHFVYAIDDTAVWAETKFFEGSFLFSADSVRPGGYTGRWHTFYIKAVDNDGVESFPDQLTFDATTIAPRTTISTPRCDDTRYTCQGAMSVGTSFRVIWSGTDLDSRSPAKRPVAYTWRLFNTSIINPTMGVDNDSLLLNTPDGVVDPTSHWSEPTPQTSLQFQDLALGVFWQFAVRAIDEAGAIEPGLKMNRNVIFFRTTTSTMAPRLYVSESYSSWLFPDNGPVWNREAGVQGSLAFSWRGDASLYGGTVSGYIYGVDIDDLSDPEQWEGDWNGSIRGATVHFDVPGPHYLYVKVKDNADVETLGIVEMEILDFEFDRGVLYVDDYFDMLPSDLTHDNLREAILRCAMEVSDTVDVFNCCAPGPNNQPRELPDIILCPSLAQVSRYKLIIWDADATRNSFRGGLWSALQNNVLNTYLRAGGSLWLFGVSSLRGSAPVPGSFLYGTAPSATHFASIFLKVSGAVDMVPFLKYQTRGDAFRGAWPDRAEAGDKFPSLDALDYSLGGIDAAYGLSRVETIMTAMQDPDVSQRPDTVYYYKANYPTSTFNMKVCAVRYHDAFSGSKVFWMGFPIHYFFVPKAESLVCAVVDWVFDGQP